MKTQHEIEQMKIKIEMLILFILYIFIFINQKVTNILNRMYKDFPNLNCLDTLFFWRVR